MTPFIILSGICIYYADWSNLLIVTESPSFDGEWMNLFNVLFWNMGGFDCISTVAGEVENPAKVLPRALFVAIGMVAACYLIPLSAAAAAANPPALTWEDGDWSIIAKNMGGDWLLYAVIISTFFGNMGIFIANMFEDAWQLNGMAEQGLVPSVFAKRLKKYDTPYVSVGLAFIIIATLCAFDFSFILPVDTFFSSCAATLEFLAYGKLAWSRPNMNRPFRVPGVRGKGSLCLFLAFPLTIGFTVLFTSFFIGVEGAVMNVCGLLLGVALYYGLKHFGYINYKYVSKSKKGLLDDLDPAAVIPNLDNDAIEQEALLTSRSPKSPQDSTTAERERNRGTYDPLLVKAARDELKMRMLEVPAVNLSL